MVSQVRDWMTFEPVAVREDGGALEALDPMVERGIRHLPVGDAANRDRRAQVRAGTTLEHAARMLSEHRVGCRPVVDARARGAC